ncbi:hypothetical protein EJ04DRAFT_132911 [Polyplosphaeria fusca]|uniref:Zn(2)-C6 fungal-type domain-containing protein n=1 Tax=Polyplosphaeria fusca TaxID=682080 RepID=A0A9P4QMH2_9PLEO|nr:hypothetical protein EJ04DRAFT_132911 [Polyplosphaeria fusca]
MVNVAGRSKGCSNCRRAKVKCDQARPTCQRCQRRGQDCDGPRDVAFVTAKIVGSRHRTEKRARSQNSSTPAAENSGKEDVSAPSAPSAPPARRKSPMSAILCGDKYDMYICFSRQWFRRGAPLDLSLDVLHPDKLLTAGTAGAGASLFPTCVLSFAAIYFGTQHRVPDITRMGYAVHGRALLQLNAALVDPNCYVRDDVLLAVSALAILEGLVPTAPKSYLNHMLGLERLMELRDPRVYYSELSMGLYKATRHMIIFSSLRTGRASVMARDEWKEALRRGCGEKELQEQSLYDLLADCAVVNVQRDEMLKRRDAGAEGVSRLEEEVHNKAMQLLGRVRSWKKQWDDEYTEVPAHTYDTKESKSPIPFPTVFEFSNNQAATMLMFYNTTLIHVLRILVTAAPPPSPSNAARDADDWAMQISAAEHAAALEICQCVPFLFRHNNRSGHSPVVQWSVMSAWETLGSGTWPEGRWLKERLGEAAGGLVMHGIWNG